MVRPKTVFLYTFVCANQDHFRIVRIKIIYLIAYLSDKVLNFKQRSQLFKEHNVIQMNNWMIKWDEILFIKS